MTWRMSYGGTEETAQNLVTWLTGPDGPLHPSQATLIDDKTIEFTDAAIRILKQLGDEDDGVVGYEGDDSQLVMWVGGVSWPIQLEA